MASIGDESHTGQTCQTSGVYRFVRHMSSCRCTPTAEEREIPLSRGETFPPCRSTSTGVVWKLIRYA